MSLPTEQTVASWADALRADPIMLDASWALKRWTLPAIEQLAVGYDGERYTFPVRDPEHALIGLVRYAPRQLLSNGQPKSIADAGSKRNLYPAPEDIESNVIWLVEGESDAVTATAAGLPAVAVPGTGGWRSEWAERFDSRDVRVLMDCDSSGRDCAERIAYDLVTWADAVRVVSLDGDREDGYDLGDFVLDAEQPDELPGVRALLESLANGTEVREAPPPVVPDGPRLTRAADITPKKMEWLWHGRIPRAAITLLLGMPGLGKSMLTCKLAAEATQTGEPVILMTAEDLYAETVIPRLKAERAELESVHFMAMYRRGFEETPRLPDDVLDLELMIRRSGAKLVIIDPLAAHFGRDVDSFRDQSVRTALAPLKGVAERTGCVILIVAHLNKSPSTDPILRSGGSVGIIGTARSALLLERDPADPEGAEGSQRILAQAKLNLARFAPSLAYTIESVYLEDHPEIDTAKLVCTGESDYAARDLLGAPTDRAEALKVDEAVEWLEGELADGPVAVKNLKERVRQLGFSWRTVETAKQTLGVVATRIGGLGGEGLWSWRLQDSEEEAGD